ncbi:hypothetical protein C3941_20690 [Kaistia algarum]|uniref:hypothetical protein n=1 Tax=Kaistia algarum TaxID=2083279 RepID=UPI000CE8586C|nr:hypothetical protein [Kaistia algarum]MCX5516031.1 hypothetical protein [Kaistia algarum]PPE77961.1 hypothetical protein C3941_20690 [Kaistia algarum]
MRAEAITPLPPVLRSRISSAEDAARLCHRIEATMDALLQLIEGESELLRSGKSIAAAALEPAKNDCARAYMAELDLIRASGAEIDAYAPGSVERLRHRHEEFVSLLQIDLAALATARASVEPESARPTRRAAAPQRERTQRAADPRRSWSAPSEAEAGSREESALRLRNKSFERFTDR